MAIIVPVNGEMVNTQALKCMGYGMNLMQDISISLTLLHLVADNRNVVGNAEFNEAGRSFRFPSDSDKLWETIGDYVANVGRDISDAAPECGINALTPLPTRSGKVVIDYDTALANAVKQHDADRAIDTLNEMLDGLQRGALLNPL
jgi:hypothetical protein